MKRMKVMIGKRRMMVLLTLTVLVLAAAALIASSASFTATSANPGNVFTAGNLGMTNDRAGNPIVTFTTPKMRPGDTVNGTVKISNTGDVPGAFTLTKSVLTGSAALAGKLDLLIQEVDSTGATVLATPYNAKLGGAISGLSLGTWAGPSTHYYKFTVTWDNSNSPAQDTADNLLMGASCSYGFTWDAVANNTIN
jgi:spore coat-associated protein N